MTSGTCGTQVLSPASQVSVISRSACLKGTLVCLESLTENHREHLQQLDVPVTKLKKPEQTVEVIPKVKVHQSQIQHQDQSGGGHY